MGSLFCGAHIRGLKPLFCDARSTNLCFGNLVLRFPCFHDLTGSLLGSNFIDKQTALFDNLTKYSSVQTDRGAWFDNLTNGAWFDNLTNGAGNHEPELCLKYIWTTSFLPAAVAWGAGEPLNIEEVEVAPPQAMEVRIKVHYTALCHTDLYFWEAKGQNPLFPCILGQEAAGYDVQALQSSISKQKYLMHCSVHLLKSYQMQR